MGGCLRKGTMNARNGSLRHGLGHLGPTLSAAILVARACFAVPAGGDPSPLIQARRAPGSIYEGLPQAPGKLGVVGSLNKTGPLACGQTDSAGNAGPITPLTLDCGLCSGHYMQQDPNQYFCRYCASCSGVCPCICYLRYYVPGGSGYYSGSRICYHSDGECATCRLDQYCANWDP